MRIELKENGNFKNIYRTITENIKNNSKNNNYIFVGKYGTGKTLLMNIVKTLLEQKKHNSIEILDFNEVFQDYIRVLSSNFSDKNEAIRRIKSIANQEVLLMDELGDNHENQSQAQINFTKEILMKRYRMIEKFPDHITIFATNLTFTEIEKVYGERIASRCYKYNIVKFKGDDFRRNFLSIIE